MDDDDENQNAGAVATAPSEPIRTIELADNAPAWARQLADGIAARDSEHASEITDLRARLDEQRKRADELALQWGSRNDAGKPKAEKRVSFSKICRALLSGNWDHAGFEREVCRDPEARHVDAMARADLGTGTDATGGVLVPEEYLPEMFIELLRAKTIALRLGATSLDGLTGSVRIPMQDGGGTAYMVAEHGDITESNLTTDELTLTPHEMAALTVTSKRLVMMGNPSVEAMIQNDLARVLGLKLDDQVLHGDGTGANLTGIDATTGINTTAMDAVPTFLLLEAMMYEVEADNADEGSLGWGMNPREWSTIRRIVDTTGRPLMGSLAEGATKRLLGHPVATSSQIPINLGAGTDEGRVFFGNWADLIIGSWGGLVIEVSGEAGDAFKKHQLWIKVLREVDCGVRHPVSFVVDDTVRRS